MIEENALEVKQIEDAKVVWNYDSLKTALESNVEKYKDIAVTEETLKDCQSMQKDLAGLRIAIDGKKKEVKQKLEIPIKEFEEKCRTLLSIVAMVEDPIKAGIQVFEDERKKKLETMIRETINKMIPEGLPDKYRVKLVISPVWLNKTQKWKDTEKEILSMIQGVKDLWEREKSEIDLIVSLCQTASEGLKLAISPDSYIERYGYGTSIAILSTEITRESARRKQAETEVKQEAVEAEKDKIPMPPPLQRKEVPVSVETQGGPKQVTVSLEITGTVFQLTELKKYMQENGITFRKID